MIFRKIYILNFIRLYTSRLEDTLRKAVIKHGAPASIYVDNGKIYISEQFKLLCAAN